MKRSNVLRALPLLLTLAFLAGCNNGSSGRSEVAGLLASQVSDGDGFTLAADPQTVVIDLGDPSTPTDPGNGKKYGETTLRAVALDASGAPQADVPVRFTASAGTLASEGQPVNTDAQGVASDTLRVFEDGPAAIDVSATDGERSETLSVQVEVRQPNQPPVANAGPDRTEACVAPDGVVRLDGSASEDPDSTAGTNDDIVRFEWFEDFGAPTQKGLGEGEILDAALGVGSHVVTLEVTDSHGATDTDEATIEVQDREPPVVRLSFDPPELWAPNHKLVDVHAGVQVLDCSPVTVTLVSVTSSEPDNGSGDGNTVGDIQGADTGTEDYDFRLRAERSGHGRGRIYTIVYRVVDALGLETLATGTVAVPHDQGH